MKSNNELKLKTAKLSLYIGLLIFITKITAYLITGSSAIFSDAAESVVHILATGMVLYSIILSSRPPDRTHLYGHGNIEYFSAGIEGLLIVIAAITIIYFAVSDIITGHQPKELNIGTLLIAFSGIVNLILGFYIVKKGKETDSLALVADGKHILTDSYTSIGVVFGLLIVIATDYFILDPLIAIIIALNIIVTGYKLVRESVGGLMMETDDNLFDEIAKSLNSMRESYYIDVHELRFRKSADIVFIDFHLTIPFFFTIIRSHEIEEKIKENLSQKFINVQIKIHFDFCQPYLCSYCKYENCPERESEFRETVDWTNQKLIGEPIREENG